jgi:hypothetical protein
MRHDERACALEEARLLDVSGEAVKQRRGAHGRTLARFVPSEPPGLVERSRKGCRSSRFERWILPSSDFNVRAAETRTNATLPNFDSYTRPAAGVTPCLRDRLKRARPLCYAEMAQTTFEWSKVRREVRRCRPRR